ncbi:MAG: sugar phosphate isomerase/epimerase, partial [Verrucomicrobiota bacterium]|nr:sugar phosphate isomerase/epimerase [Verrucomicrobiota bacterium]
MQSQDDPTPRLTAPWGVPEPSGNALSRRSAFKLAMGAASLAAAGTAAPGAQAAPDSRRAATKSYGMKKSINLWAFPYPDRMNLRECLQLAKDAGFEGIELNYDLESDLSPKAGPRDFQKIRKMADDIGIAISGLCSFLFWPYPLTSNDPT